MDWPPVKEIGKIQLAIYGACTAHASQVAYVVA